MVVEPVAAAAHCVTNKGPQRASLRRNCYAHPSEYASGNAAGNHSSQILLLRSGANGRNKEANSVSFHAYSCAKRFTLSHLHRYRIQSATQRNEHRKCTILDEDTADFVTYLRTQLELYVRFHNVILQETHIEQIDMNFHFLRVFAAESDHSRRKTFPNASGYSKFFPAS